MVGHCSEHPLRRSHNLGIPPAPASCRSSASESRFEGTQACSTAVTSIPPYVPVARSVCAGAARASGSRIPCITARPSAVVWTGCRNAVTAKTQSHPQRMKSAKAGRVKVGHQQIERWMS
jgi:hypothetical protein